MVPRLNDYAWRLWDYWERNLDPELFIDRSLRGHVRDKTVVITGASSGIGYAASLMMARAGAKVIMVLSIYWSITHDDLSGVPSRIHTTVSTILSAPCSLTISVVYV